MKQKFNGTQLLAIAGMALMGVATLIQNYAQKNEQREMIKEEVNKALAEKSGKEEES